MICNLCAPSGRLGGTRSCRICGGWHTAGMSCDAKGTVSWMQKMQMSMERLEHALERHLRMTKQKREEISLEIDRVKKCLGMGEGKIYIYHVDIPGGEKPSIVGDILFSTRIRLIYHALGSSPMTSKEQNEVDDIMNELDSLTQE